MSKKKIKDEVADLIKDYLDENQLELWNIEFVKEVKDWFLRVYVDLKNPEEGQYIGIEQCEGVSRYLSDVLDEKDVIEQNYYLEVSSPGLDRELITRDHYRRYIGQLIEVKLYKPIEGKKHITCLLEEVADDSITISLEGDENKIVITNDQIAKANLAVVF